VYHLIHSNCHQLYRFRENIRGRQALFVIVAIRRPLDWIHNLTTFSNAFLQASPRSRYPYNSRLSFTIPPSPSNPTFSLLQFCFNLYTFMAAPSTMYPFWHIQVSLHFSSHFHPLACSFINDRFCGRVLKVCHVIYDPMRHVPSMRTDHERGVSPSPWRLQRCGDRPRR